MSAHRKEKAKGTREKGRNHSPIKRGLTTIPSLFLHPVEVLGVCTCVPNMFFKPLGLGGWDARVM